MKNDPDHLLRLLREARIDSSRAEYAFETRVSARLAAETRPSTGQLAWRFLPGFAAAGLLTAVALVTSWPAFEERGLDLHAMSEDTGLPETSLLEFR